MSKLSRAEKKALKKQNSLLKVEDTCINCAEYIALDQRFCSHCGGKRIYNRLTWRNLIEDFVDRFLNLENSFLRTFVAMFTRPDEVIGGYMNGMRKKYLPAFSYFAIALTIAGVYSFLLKNYFADVFTGMQADASTMFVSDPEQLAMQKEFAEGWAEEWIELATDYQSMFYFAAIPLLAVISRIVFWNYKKYNFVEHLVIYLYAYSHTAMITSVLYICFMWSETAFQIIGFAGMPLAVLYIGYVLKRLFKLDAAGIILKTALFGVVLTAITVVIGGIFGGLLIFNLLKNDGQPAENESSFVKIMRESFEQGKRKGEEMSRKKKVKDSIEQDSVKRLEDILEITPDMIKNRPQ